MATPEGAITSTETWVETPVVEDLQLIEEEVDDNQDRTS